MSKERPHFRFEDLEIWQDARELSARFHKIADGLAAGRHFRYAEQLRAAGISVSNNIAEGSGSQHVKEFKHFLNVARRSLFENASMLLVFETLALLDGDEVTSLLWMCDSLSRKITKFSRSLK